MELFKILQKKERAEERLASKNGCQRVPRSQNKQNPYKFGARAAEFVKLGNS